MFDRWAIVEAHYWFCANYHTGQWSKLYKRLCKISTYYKPGLTHRGPTTPESNAIYERLVLALNTPYVKC